MFPLPKTLPTVPFTLQDIVDIFQSGEKPENQRLIGIERECFLYDDATQKRLDYPRIQKLLTDFCEHHAYTPTYEGYRIIGAERERSALSLEPGGQFEYAGPPLTNLHEGYTDLERFDQNLDALLKKHHAFKRVMGFEPLWAQKDLSWMPKDRYTIMREYMPTRGALGFDMMRRTCTLQINMDYISEYNMAQMMFTAQALSPLMGAIFAASPLYEGRDSTISNRRAYTWQDTDPDRCGLLDIAFQGFTHGDTRPTMTYEDYARHMLSVPMYFIKREGVYHSMAGESFAEYWAGDVRPNTLPDATPSLDDVRDHMTTLFPAVRLKTFIEVRCLDASPIAFSGAAFFTGLLYDNDALNQACTYLSQFPKSFFEAQDHRLARSQPDPHDFDMLGEVLPLAHQGLKNRGLGEEQYLEILLNAYHTRSLPYAKV